MSHRDQDVHTELSVNAQDLAGVFQWLLKGLNLNQITFREDCTWTPKGLVLVALLWTWSSSDALGNRLTQAWKIGRRLMPACVAEKVTYQAFMKLLVRWTLPLILALKIALRERMKTEMAEHFRIAGFAVFAVDGSRLELPRTESNEARFSSAKSKDPKDEKDKKKKGKNRKTRSGKRQRRTAAQRAQHTRQKKLDNPQLWLTTFWHAGTGLPWDWRIGPSDSSERQHAVDMLNDLPEDALITADAGFVGYEFWKTLLDGNRPFVIRVGANVQLLKKLGRVRESADTVYLWPKYVMQKNQPPLRLRLIVVRGMRHPWYLVTSVGSKKELSDRQAAQIYNLRWGIELYYRHFKQTFGRHKLRSRKAEHAECEAHWSMVGLTAMLLHAKHYLQDKVPPDQVSVAGVLFAYRFAMGEYKSGPDPGESLWEQLAEAQLDSYERTNKTSREYPRKTHGKALKPPKVKKANKEQITTDKSLRTKGLTA